jgi:preprotein translocase subunit SecB
MSDQQAFNIQRIYLKEATLEQPNSPALLLEQDQPNIEISLDVVIEPTSVRPNIHEVIVNATVLAKSKDKILFRAMCKQAGLFEILNVGEMQLAAVLNVVCPQIIYPYLRSSVTDLIVRGSFTPVHLAELNFRAMYEQRLAKQRTQGQTAAPGAPLKTG